MNHIRVFAAFLVVCFLAGCASVPPESVELSKTIGKGLADGRLAHMATLNAYFDSRKASNDAWILDVYFLKVVDRSEQGMKNACKSKGDTSVACSQLTLEEYKTIVKDVIAFRDEMQTALEKSKQETASLIDEHYANLQNGNAAITGLLSSIVDVKKSTKEAGSSISSNLGIKIDFDKITQTFDDFLLKAGGTGAKAQELSSAVKKLTGKPE